jgi:hypothetical protein
LSAIVEARQVTEIGYEGHRDDELHAPQGLQRFDHWLQSPGVHVF